MSEIESVAPSAITVNFYKDGWHFRMEYAPDGKQSATSNGACFFEPMLMPLFRKKTDTFISFQTKIPTTSLAIGVQRMAFDKTNNVVNVSKKVPFTVGNPPIIENGTFVALSDNDGRVDTDSKENVKFKAYGDVVEMGDSGVKMTFYERLDEYSTFAEKKSAYFFSDDFAIFGKEVVQKTLTFQIGALEPSETIFVHFVVPFIPKFVTGPINVGNFNFSALNTYGKNKNCAQAMPVDDLEFQMWQKKYTLTVYGDVTSEKNKSVSWDKWCGVGGVLDLSVTIKPSHFLGDSERCLLSSGLRVFLKNQNVVDPKISSAIRDSVKADFFQKKSRGVRLKRMSAAEESVASDDGYTTSANVASYSRAETPENSSRDGGTEFYPESLVFGSFNDQEYPVMDLPFAAKEIIISYGNFEKFSESKKNRLSTTNCLMFSEGMFRNMESAQLSICDPSGTEISYALSANGLDANGRLLNGGSAEKTRLLEENGDLKYLYRNSPEEKIHVHYLGQRQSIDESERKKITTNIYQFVFENSNPMVEIKNKKRNIKLNRSGVPPEKNLLTYILVLDGAHFLQVVEEDRNPSDAIRPIAITNLMAIFDEKKNASGKYAGNFSDVYPFFAGYEKVLESVVLNLRSNLSGNYYTPDTESEVFSKICLLPIFLENVGGICKLAVEATTEIRMSAIGIKP